mgnify:CR=1 FL=1
MEATISAQVIEYSNLTQGLTIFGGINVVIYTLVIGFCIGKIDWKKVWRIATFWMFWKKHK